MLRHLSRYQPWVVRTTRNLCTYHVRHTYASLHGIRYCSSSTQSQSTSSSTITNVKESQAAGNEPNAEILEKLKELETKINEVHKNGKPSMIRRFFILLYFTPVVICYMLMAHLWRSSKQKRESNKKEFKVLNIRTSLIRESTSDITTMLSSGEAVPISFQSLLDCIRRAHNDDTVLGISLTLDEGSTIGFAQTQELMEELQRFKQKRIGDNSKSNSNSMSDNVVNNTGDNKFVVAYGRVINMRDFLLSTICDEFYLQPSGILNIFGLNFPNLFFKDMLTKLGIDTVIYKREKYKTFADMFCETSMTQEHRDSMLSLGNDMHGQYLNILQSHLDLDNLNDAQSIVDHAPYVAQESYDNGLIDGAMQLKDYQARLGERAYRLMDNAKELAKINNPNSSASDSNNNSKENSERSKKSDNKESDDSEDNDESEILFLSPKEYLKLAKDTPKFRSTIKLLKQEQSSSSVTVGGNNSTKEHLHQPGKKHDEINSAVASGNDNGTTKNIALINVFGEIHSGETDGMNAGAETICKLVKSASQDSRIGGIVLRIDSPGGDAIASETIWNSVMNARATSNKPVVVSMGDVCASGGYYIASAADKIVAMPATITGSIGVIMVAFIIEKMLNKIGINHEQIKFSKNADILSPFHEPSESVKERFETMIDSMYDIFLTRVSKGRNMDRKSVREIAQGKVWTGKQASKNGLVDELGGLYDAKRLCQELAGLPIDSQDIKLIKFAGRSERLLDILDMWSDVGMTGQTIVSIIRSLYTMKVYLNKFHKMTNEAQSQTPQIKYLFEPGALGLVV